MLARISLFFFVISLPFLSIFAQAKEETKIEPKVELKFSIDTRFGMSRGVFKKSTIMIKDRKLGKGIIEIDVASIDTGITRRDTHLRDEDFFDVQKFPKAEFEILGIDELGQDVIRGNGKLTIKGITKEYVFQASVVRTADTEKYSGSIKINRKDFGIEYQNIVNPIDNIANLEYTVTLPLKK